MKALTKRIAIAGVSAACAVTLVTGASLLAERSDFAIADSNVTSTYYYDNLNVTTTSGNKQEYTLAKKFYKALDELNESGAFKSGVVDLSLTEKELATSDEIKKWVENGDLTIPKAFSAARDSYFLDHPELFYVDLYKLTISAGRSNGVYSAFIDCGREVNCYVDGSGFTKQSDVEAAITTYETKLNAAVQEARTEAAKVPVGEQDMLLAQFANKVIAESVEYDFEELESGSTDGYSKPFTGNAYGALVIGECVCSGYSFAYKAVMDKLGVPCVIVAGYSVSQSSDGSYNVKGDAHSWNQVWLKTPDDTTASAASYAAYADAAQDGAWYAYDVTWNSTGGNVNSYVNMGAFTTEKKHLTDPVISSSGYNMPYPELSTVNYGHAPATEEFSHRFVYTALGGNDDYGNPLMGKDEYVSYQGIGAVALLNEGLHIACRFAYYKEGVLTWTMWQDLGASLVEFGFGDDGIQSKVMIANNGLYSQYAVLDIAPDLNYNPSNPDFTFNNNIYYSEVDANAAEDYFGDHTLYISELYTNLSFGTYTPAPYITKTTPSHTQLNFIADWMASSEDSAIMADKNAITIEVTYDEELYVLDPSKPIGISFVAEYANAAKYASFTPLHDTTYVELLEDKHTLKFRFKPSLMYEHNRILYSFYFDNVGSAKLVYGADGTSKKSDKLPNPAHYIFERTYTACNQRLGGGRFWIECCAQPTLVSNSDLAAMDFTDENGNSTFSENARSQMMLVVETVNPEVKSEMESTVGTELGITDIGTKSATYDIDLQMCGKVAKITDGSYVKIALGFPEGFGPDDEGVTFKIYHREHKGGGVYEIVEVPCVVTKFGIVATVTSFSPYMVVAVDQATLTDTTKTIYATIDGKGGTLSKEDGQIKSVAEGGKCVYNFTHEDNYAIYKVTLNGSDITSKVGADGKLELNYAELASNNELIVQYISDAAASRFAEKQLDRVEPVRVVVAAGSDLYLVEDLGGNNTGLIVALCIIAVVVVAAAVVAVFYFRKKKAPANGAPAKETATKSEAKPAAKQTATKSETKPAAKQTATKQTTGKSASKTTASKSGTSNKTTKK